MKKVLFMPLILLMFAFTPVSENEVKVESEVEKEIIVDWCIECSDCYIDMQGNLHCTDCKVVECPTPVE